MVDYYLNRRHLRRLVFQCGCPFLFLVITEILLYGVTQPIAGLRGLVSDIANSIGELFRFNVSAEGDPPWTPAYGLFLGCAVYSEAILASWRIDMKNELQSQLLYLDKYLERTALAKTKLALSDH